MKHYGKADKIEALLSKMTIEEKVAQMQQLSENATPKELFKTFKKDGKIGSYLHVLGKDTGEFLESAAQTELKIPPIFGIDAIHGHAFLKQATIFPSQLAMACTWEEGVLEKMGEITADEVAADGLNWVFSPVLCLGRDLRWGRVDETFGEDAELCARLGAAIIRGYQKSGKVAACAKHYLAYGEATGGRDAYDIEITERKAREIFLKPFKAAVDEGCLTFMTAYGSIDGEPLTISKRYLTEILKEEFGFDGFVVTDWKNFWCLITGQKTFENMDEACVEGVEAGNDMSMNSYEFYGALIQAVKEGRIAQEVIDNAVRRILSVKARLGLLDEEKTPAPPKECIGCKAHQAYNYEVSVKSAVLLKNNGVLPLKQAKKIAVLGPNADDLPAQYGDWTYTSHRPKDEAIGIEKENEYTLLKGIQEVYKDSEIVYAKGCSVLGSETSAESDLWMQEALELAKGADAVIVAIGDVHAQNGEEQDRAKLVLSGRQNELIKRVKELGKQVIAVLINGKPLALGEMENYADAIIEAFNTGDMGGLALASLIQGKENFSGKLPISFPYDSAATPCYYNQYEYWHGDKYLDIPKGSPYPFGFGLSYNRYTYGEATLSKTKAKIGDTVELHIPLTNEGDMQGEEIVQLYFKDKVCKILTPIRTLLDFQKTALYPKQTCEIVFTIDTSKLGYYDRNCNYQVDEGEFTFFVSGDGKTFKTVDLLLVK